MVHAFGYLEISRVKETRYKGNWEKEYPSEVASCSAKQGCMISTSRFHYHFLKCVFFLGRSLLIFKLKWIDESVCVFSWTMSPTVNIQGGRWMTLMPAFLCHPHSVIQHFKKPVCSFLLLLQLATSQPLINFSLKLVSSVNCWGFSSLPIETLPEKQNVDHTNVFLKLN